MPAKVRSTLYEQHEAPAEGLIGAIRNGELHVIQPRPSGPGTLRHPPLVVSCSAPFTASGAVPGDG